MRAISVLNLGDRKLFKFLRLSFCLQFRRISMFTVVMLLLLSLSCKRKEPTYVVKEEVGDNSASHYDPQEGESLRSRLKMSEFQKERAAKQKRDAMDQQRGIYHEQSRWRY